MQIEEIKEALWGLQLMVTRGEGCREGIVREFGMDVYTLLYSKWITDRAYCMAQGPLLKVMWQPGGEFGEEWIHVYVWLSPFAVHLRLSQCC